MIDLDQWRAPELFGASYNGVENPPYLLESLDSLPLGDCYLRLTNLRPSGYAEQKRFDFCLADAHGCICAKPILSGIYSAGRPSQFITGWIDAVASNHVCFAGPLHPNPEYRELTLDGLLADLFRSVGNLIPPNGRLWLAYEVFSAEGSLHRETQRALSLHFPLVVTPIGYLLFHAGCWAGLRDWYIPEGWREGPRKLQGNKPLNAEHAARRAAETAHELLAFLKHEPDAEPDLVQASRKRAIHVLESLPGYLNDPALVQQIRQELHTAIRRFS